mmetsp:Transcript_20994/g.45995  ORF Transcript_20994/g.45995 Transcript_20994/m.45995 type:complete len:537 (-) Transcript_20994:653-2263(-)|eukprot:CAMPEP_0202900648 /NCGR_PEP_ID=MMETSP1392-20130828/11959_1 /ASSEMBLY_ACC=CAM_ASM_000868 /TAXON_ID=225041 /ORGANISM="Chlamydomonas chlamydogama, Strain SAG 11-48b" /LENGTH=536 /DNA_ID=CAMNT_0049587083 /DNA_START=177 /DNA_END=1787 /DNA_ORIENTATION=-
MPQKKTASINRRPIHFWKPFNDWWRVALERSGRRPLAEEINQWYEEYSDLTWPPDEKPTLQETRVHAKCLRSVDAVRLYFRKYRASKKGQHGSSQDDEDDDEGPSYSTHRDTYNPQEHSQSQDSGRYLDQVHKDRNYTYSSAEGDGLPNKFARTQPRSKRQAKFHKLQSSGALQPEPMPSHHKVQYQGQRFGIALHQTAPRAGGPPPPVSASLGKHSSTSIYGIQPQYPGPGPVTTGHANANMNGVQRTAAFTQPFADQLGLGGAAMANLPEIKTAPRDMLARGALVNLPVSPLGAIYTMDDENLEAELKNILGAHTPTLGGGAWANDNLSADNMAGASAAEAPLSATHPTVPYNPQLSKLQQSSAQQQFSRCQASSMGLVLSSPRLMGMDTSKLGDKQAWPTFPLPPSADRLAKRARTLGPASDDTSCETGLRTGTLQAWPPNPARTYAHPGYMHANALNMYAQPGSAAGRSPLSQYLDYNEVVIKSEPWEDDPWSTNVLDQMPAVPVPAPGMPLAGTQRGYLPDFGSVMAQIQH